MFIVHVATVIVASAQLRITRSPICYQLFDVVKWRKPVITVFTQIWTRIRILSIKVRIHGSTDPLLLSSRPDWRADPQARHPDDQRVGDRALYCRYDEAQKEEEKILPSVRVKCHFIKVFFEFRQCLNKFNPTHAHIFIMVTLWGSLIMLLLCGCLVGYGFRRGFTYWTKTCWFSAIFLFLYFSTELSSLKVHLELFYRIRQ